MELKVPHCKFLTFRNGVIKSTICWDIALLPLHLVTNVSDNVSVEEDIWTLKNETDASYLNIDNKIPGN
jgi:hypothetical protein